MIRFLLALLLCGLLPGQFQGLWWRVCEDLTITTCYCPMSGGIPAIKNPTVVLPTGSEVWAQGTMTVAWSQFDPGQAVMVMLVDSAPTPFQILPCFYVAPNIVLVGTVDAMGQATVSWPLPTSAPFLPPGRTRLGEGQVVEVVPNQPWSSAAACSSLVFYIDAQN